jgi:hypothetical protein
MERLKSFSADELQFPETASDVEEKLLLVDDANFVSAFVEAGQRRGKHLVCVRCFHPERPLRAVMLLVDGTATADECSGSVGFCRECYRDLTELMFHDAVLRAAKSTAS